LPLQSDRNAPASAAVPTQRAPFIILSYKTPQIGNRKVATGENGRIAEQRAPGAPMMLWFAALLLLLCSLALDIIVKSTNAPAAPAPAPALEPSASNLATNRMTTHPSKAPATTP